MADQAKKISNLATLTGPNGNTVVVVNHTNNSITNTYQLTLTNLFGNSTCNVVLNNTSVLSSNIVIVRNKQTPANSNITITEGTILFDTSYIYIAVANNTLKRVALESF